MTSPNAFNVRPKSRQFEPDATHARRGLRDKRLPYARTGQTATGPIWRQIL